MTDMAVGRRYKILMQRQPSLTPVIAVLDYVDETNSKYVMSGRPILGEQYIPRHWVLEIEEVPSDTPCRIPPNSEGFYDAI